MKILVVDDVGYTCHFHSRLIEKYGYAVCSATSGYEALQHLKTDNEINIVLTDLIMPGMDGIDLFQEAQKVERYTDEGPLNPPQFILMTALRMEKNSQDKDVHRLKLAKELGISKVMFKPLDQDELEETLKDLMISATSSSSSAKPLDLLKTTQELKDAVKDIIDSKNSAAAEKFIRSLNEEVACLKSFMETLQTV